MSDEEKIRFSCTHCGKAIRVPTKRRNTEVPCPHCHQPTNVPEKSEPTRKEREEAERAERERREEVQEAAEKLGKLRATISMLGVVASIIPFIGTFYGLSSLEHYGFLWRHLLIAGGWAGVGLLLLAMRRKIKPTESLSLTTAEDPGDGVLPPYPNPIVDRARQLARGAVFLAVLLTILNLAFYSRAKYSWERERLLLALSLGCFSCGPCIATSSMVSKYRNELRAAHDS